MDKTKTERPKDWREARCVRVWKLHQKGWKQAAIAEALEVTRGC